MVSFAAAPAGQGARLGRRCGRCSWIASTVRPCYAFTGDGTFGDGAFSRTPAGALTFPRAIPPSDAEVAKVLGAGGPVFCAFLYWRVGLCKTQSGYGA